MSFPHFLVYIISRRYSFLFLAIQSPGELETFSKLVQSQQNENDNNQIVQVDEDEQTTEQDTSSSPSISDSLLLSSSPVQFVSLGSTTLRAETAAITAVVAVQMHRDTVKKL